MIRQKNAGLMLLLVLCSALLGAQAPQGVDKPSPLTRRILILNELDPYSVAIAQIDDGIRDSLRGSKSPIEIYPEYMDTSLFPDKADQQLIRNFYFRKYRDHRPDVIITVGSAPLQFMEEEHSKEFAGIPVVFCLPSGAEKNLKLDPDYTGVMPGIHAATTLKAALQMLPKTKHLYVVSGAGPYDLMQIQDVKEQLEGYSRRVDITYLAGLPMPELLKQVGNLPKDSIVLFSSLVMDGTGKFYTSRRHP